jgi:hypothetical protein
VASGASATAKQHPREGEEADTWPMVSAPGFWCWAARCAGPEVESVGPCSFLFFSFYLFFSFLYF